jgi:hypothetical protein
MAEDKKKARAVMGRPIVPDKLRIDQRVPIMLRQSEAELVKKAANQAGLTVSAWGRKLMVEAAGGSIE